MKVALVHDWLTGMRGGERCLDAFLKIYPDADIFTLLHEKGKTNDRIDQAVKGTSFLQKIPGIAKLYKLFLPIFPNAVTSLKIPEGYDLVISLSHAAVKNVKVPKGALHICYCFTPMRYIWDQVAEYLGWLRFPAWPMISYLRRWDLARLDAIDDFVAISRFVSARIRCYYKRESFVVYPPVDSFWFSASSEKTASDYFLCAGALVPYKRIDLAVKAFNKNGLRLVIAGKGSELIRLKRIAKKNIEFVTAKSDAELAKLYQNARAFIFPGKEDFGIMPVEAMACGRPVIGLAHGGLLETVRAVRIGMGQLPSAHQIREFGLTGVLAEDVNNSVEALQKAINFFIDNENCFSAEACKIQAKKFSFESFQASWQEVVLACGLEPISAVRKRVQAN